MFTIKFDDGFYGAGASIRLYENNKEVACHWYSDNAARTKLLCKKSESYLGRYDGETQRYELSSFIPPALLNALRDPQQAPRLPMVDMRPMTSQEVASLKTLKVDEKSYRRQGLRVRYVSGVVVHERWMIALLEDDQTSFCYYEHREIRDITIVEVYDKKTKKRFITVNQKYLGETSDKPWDRPFGRHVTHVLVKKDRLLIQTDTREIHVMKEWFKD